MDIEQLERRLEWWKRFLFLSIGVCITLLVLAFSIVPDGHLSTQWGWYLLWFIAQSLVTPAGFVLVGTKSWRTLPLDERLNTAFGYMAVAWFLFFSFIQKTNQDNGNPDGLGVLLFYGLFMGCGIALLFFYRTLRHSRIEPEELFP